MSQKDIYPRLEKFSQRIIKLVKSLPKTTENIELGRQIIRSGPAVGANATEADGALTKKEFIRHYTIAKKEAKETHYWLKLIAYANPEMKPRLKNLTKESEEIIKIISRIIISAKNPKRQII